MLKKSIYTKAKNLKPFEIFDILIYGITAILVAVLFLFFVVLPKNGHIDGFKITLHGQELLRYETATDKFTVLNQVDGYTVDISKSENCQIITITDTDGGYNKILLDTENKSAKVIESNCSSSKDCVYSPAITKSGAIVCAPHGLKITPISSSGFTEPITG